MAKPEMQGDEESGFSWHDPLLARLGANLEQLRKQQGFTGATLAAQTRVQAVQAKSCAVEEAAIAEIEAGRANPNLTTIYAIAEALGVTIDTLVY
jgi:transcriptional regulator with XRE-family HTH domain